MSFIVITKRPIDVSDALNRVDVIADRHGVSRSVARRIAAERASMTMVVVSRVAVATLEEVPEAIREKMTRALWPMFKQQALAMTSTGGTVGPMPDGTVIEVEPAGWYALAKDSPEITTNMITRASYGYLAAREKIIAAYNAKQGGITA